MFNLFVLLSPDVADSDLTSNTDPISGLNSFLKEQISVVING